MARVDESSADCRVFTFKEGLLSPLAHDLELRVTRFSVTLTSDPPSLVASFEASSVRVVGARRDGHLLEGVLSAADKAKIERNVVTEVLRSGRFSTVRFESTAIERAGDGFAVAGELTLRGRTRSCLTTVKREAGRLVAEVPIHQPDFGIKPFTALLGTLRVQPTVRVRLSVPAELAEAL